MQLPSRKRLLRPALAVAAAALMLSSCSSLSYYAQAARGQLSLLAEARPVEDWLADAGTTGALRQRLEAARQIRRFAIDELGLPDNGSYTRFAKLPGQYVLWNVVATPELSLEPVEWCFPIAGCVNYRGYYKHDEALAYAAQLRAQGHDVDVAGVTAYSTLGWFRDPLMSTFIHYPDAELARLMFHELAHQVVYVAGDSRFNESFASAVEQEGVEAWLDCCGSPAMRDAYAQYSERRQAFLALLLRYRDALERCYDSDLPDAGKRATKARLLAQLKRDYAVLKQSWGGYAGYDPFFAQPLSNAHLAAVATYNDHVPALRALRRRSSDWQGFYAAVKQLAGLDDEAREQVLAALNPAPDAGTVVVQRSMETPP